MAKRKNTWSEEKITRYIKEGRGSGELSGYKPWLTNQDFPSEGRTHRIKGWKSNREHQLFSDIERNYFYIIDWAEDVIDIREQYPLDREKTLKISNQKLIHHPVEKSNNTPIVMTTDFLITIKEKKGFKYIARTIKPAEKLNDKRVVEKLELERQYWVNENISWGIVTELDLPTDLWRNIQLLHQHYKMDEQDVFWASTLYRELLNQDGELIEFLNLFDFKYRLDTGSALSLFKHLLANRKIQLDMKKKINFRMDIGDLRFFGDELERDIVL